MNKKNMQPERMKTEEDVHLKKKKRKKETKQYILVLFMLTELRI